MQSSGESPNFFGWRGRASSSGKAAGYRHRTDTPLERIKVYARGGLRFLAKYGKDYTYEAMLESILAHVPNAKYVVILSGGNDVYGPVKSVYEEQYEDVQVGEEIAKVAARLWYERIPGLFVFGGSAECFQYTGKKAQVFDRRANSVRRVARRMFSVRRLDCRIVSGVQELLPLRVNVVDGIGHYGGTEDAYDKFTLALAEFCMLAQSLGRSRL